MLERGRDRRGIRYGQDHIILLLFFLATLSKSSFSSVNDMMMKAEMPRMKKNKKAEVKALEQTTPSQRRRFERKGYPPPNSPLCGKEKCCRTVWKDWQIFSGARVTKKDLVVDLGDSPLASPTRVQNSPFSFGDYLMQADSGWVVYLFCRTCFLKWPARVQQATVQELDESMALRHLQACQTLIIVIIFFGRVLSRRPRVLLRQLRLEQPLFSLRRIWTTFGPDIPNWCNNFKTSNPGFRG